MYTEIPWLVKLSLTGKKINFPGIDGNYVTHYKYSMEIRNTDVLFEKQISIENGGQQ